MTTIYVVMGNTGEYSDRNEWPVKAFTSKEKAQELVINAQNAFNTLVGGTGEKDASRYYFQHHKEHKNPFDPNMNVDYTGVSYSYFEMELDDDNV